MQAMMNELQKIHAVQKRLGDKEKEMPLELKADINNFLWSNLPMNTLLGDADDLALALYSIIGQMYEGKTLKEIAQRK